MTLWAKQSAPGSTNVEVAATSGTVAIQVTEDYRHLRYFVTQLVTILDGIEQAQKEAGQ